MTTTNKWMSMLALAFLAFLPSITCADFTCAAAIGEPDAGSSLRTGTVTWKNTWPYGISAPYVRVEAKEGVLIRMSDADAWGKSIEFLATSASLPVNALKSGESGSLTFSCLAGSDDGQLELSWTLSSDDAFPWSSIGSSLKPSYVTDGAWTFALANLKSRFGSTWNNYLSRLRADANHLAELGRPVRRIDRLLQIEINNALGIDYVLPVLASVTDAARSARGMGLSFTRSYSSAMYGRFKNGILGYGWTDNLSTCAELSTDGKTLVFRVPGGGSYSFTKATDSWQPEDARDKTVLTEDSNAYRLKYQSGTVQTFAKFNMRTASIVDSSGNTLTFTWSGTTLQKITHTDGQSLTFAYSGGLLSSVTDDCGRRTSYSYSSSLLTKVTAPDGLETLYEYRAADGTAAARALSRIVYPDGTTREFAYDTSSGLVSAISVNGGKEKTTISRNGLNVTLTGPDGAATTLSLGVSGEVLKTTDALGGVATNGYTEDGLLKSVVSPSGLTGSISHDALGRVGKSVSANGAETAFAYEETFGNLKTVTDANGHAVTYGYDEQGRGKSVTFADGSSSTLEYNRRGDVVKSTNRRGQSILYEYDSQGRIKKKTWSNGRTFAYAYDEEGNLVAASDSETGQVSMYYIVGGRLRCIFYPNGRAIFYDYDSETGKVSLRKHGKATVTGRPQSPNPEYEIWQEEFKLEYDEDSEEVFAYDASGRLASVADGSGNFYLKNTYDATTGRLSKQENGNGTSVSYLYDKLGRVVSIEHRGADGKIAEALQYCYDADGRCIRAASLLGEERYTYDKDGQLTAVDYPDIANETFAYDAVGNRKTANGATYSVNNLNQYTTVSGGPNPVSAITYDRDGNLTSLTDANGTTTYTYDTLNRLVAVSNPAAGINWSCQYDVFGNRVSVTDNGVTTERIYLQGSLPSVAAEYVNGELKERHIVVGAVRVADISRTGGSPVQNEETRYYHADLIGSTRLVTDGTGAIVDRRAYKAFGETRVETDTTATAGYVGTLGVETDPTGLLFMRNRYYSPALGRFIQADPIGLNGEDINLYRYCENAPIQNYDLIGLFSWKNAILVVGGVGLMAAGAALAWTGVGLPAGAYLTAAGLSVTAPVIASGVGVAAVGTYAVAEGLEITSEVKKVGKALGGLVISEAHAEMLPAHTGVEAGQIITGKMPMDVMSNVDITLSGGGGSGSGDNDPGTGDDPGGGTVIMSESDWIKVVDSSGTYSLGADITLTDIKSMLTFSGTLNGNGHKITGAIYAPMADGWQQYVYPITGEGATFNNVVFENCLMKFAQNCTLNGCRGLATGTRLESASTFARFAVGCKFYNCTAQVTIDFQENDGIYHDRDSDGSGIAALVGTATRCTFENCSSVGSVSGDDCVGGLVGKAIGSTFTGCTSSCTVKGSQLVGGLVGSLDDGTEETPCIVKNCKATGTVSGRGWTGGLAGAIDNCKVSNCTATGNVIDDPTITAASNSDDYFGGFVGHVTEGSTGGSLIELCNASGSVTASGAEDVGGFAGLFHGNHLVQSTVRRCCCTGNVIGGDNVGGFAGNATDCAISDCYSTGSATSEGINMQSNAGGLIGSFCFSDDCALSRCYASGKITISSSATMAYSGGLMPLQMSADMLDMYASMGMLDMIISSYLTSSTSCYWNKSTTGQNYSGTGTGLSAAQAKNQSSYSGWDFGSVWKMGSAGPELRNVGATSVSSFKVAMPVVASAASETTTGLKTASAVVSAAAIAKPPRLYCYDRYVVVKDSTYGFALSTDDRNAAIHVSGLPAGFTFANGEIRGSASAVGSSTLTVTAKSPSGTTTKSVPFVVVPAPKLFSQVKGCSVAFNANGGAGTMPVQRFANGVAQPLNANAFACSGYTFKGWARSADGDVYYADKQRVSFASDMTLYAVWMKNGGNAYLAIAGPGDDHQCTYVSAARSNDYLPVICDSTWTVSANVNWITLRTTGGYGSGKVYFDLSANSSAALRVGTITVTRGGMTYTKTIIQTGVPKSYSIRFNKNDGTGTVATKQFTCGASERIPSLKNGLGWARTGFVFKGWATSKANADVGKVWKTDWAYVKDGAAAGKTLDVWAVWGVAPGYYAIRFNKNDGSGAWRTVAFQHGKTKALPSCAKGLGWTRAGYAFVGWSVSAAKANAPGVPSNIWKTDQALVSAPVASGKVLDVYAAWVKGYVVRYHKNTGETPEAIKTQGIQSGVKTRLASLKNGLGWARTGFVLKGWATSPANARAGKVWKTDWAYVTDGAAAGKTLDVWAVWGIAPGYYAIRFNTNGGSGARRTVAFKYGSAQALPSSAKGLGLTRSGYAFVGWSMSAAKANAPGVPSNIWKPDQALVASPVASGKVLDVYAAWVKGYVVRYHKNTGESPEAIKTQGIASGVKTRLASLKNGLSWARAGFVLKGWATSPANARAGKVWKTDWAYVTDGAAAGKTLDVWAVWGVAPGYYAIRFNKNDKSGTKKTVAFPYGTAKALPTCAKGLGWTRAGYAFVGWSVSAAKANAPGVSSNIWKPDQALVASPVASGKVLDVYAAWVKGYVVRYHKNTGESPEAIKTQGIASGVRTRLAALKNGLGWARAGFVLKGWATSPANARAGKVWKTDWAYVTDGAAAGKVLDVWAVWGVAPGYYAIRFNKNDKSGTKKTVAFPYGTAKALPTCAKGLGWTRAGYAFVGWSVSAAKANAPGVPSNIWKPDQAVVSAPVSAGSVLDVHASWIKGYTIRFHKNTGATPEVVRSQGFQSGVRTRLPAVRNGLGWARTGFVFKGWATSKANAKAKKVWKTDWAYVTDATSLGKVLDVWAIWEGANAVGNDNFAYSRAISGSAGSVSASNKDATAERGEPLVKKFPYAVNSIWWSWTAPASGTVRFSSSGTSFDTVMGVYSGSSLAGLATIAEDDDGGGNATSLCSFTATAGTVYHIAVAGYNNDSFGTIRLSWEMPGLKTATVQIQPTTNLSVTMRRTPFAADDSLVYAAGVLPDDGGMYFLAFDRSTGEGTVRLECDGMAEEFACEVVYADFEEEGFVVLLEDGEWLSL